MHRGAVMGGDWYVLRGADTFGPFSTDQMLQGVGDGQLKRDDLVWCRELPKWQPAAEVPGFWKPPTLGRPVIALPPLPPSPKQGDVRDLKKNIANAEGHKDPVSTKEPASNFVGRHWRGELPLGQAYWIVAVILSFIVVFTGIVIVDWIGDAHSSPVGAGITLLVFISFLIAFTIWQLVGVWRAAGNHIKRSGKRFWAVMARIAVVIGVLRAVGDSWITLPIMSESVRLIFGIDNIPPYRLQLLANGAELELSGGMPFGTADALKNVLDAAPNVETLRLNSLGGRLLEAHKIKQLVVDRGLSTYTTATCASACTIAYLGGATRYLFRDGRLGFHSLSFGGVDQKQVPEINSDYRRMLAKHGVPAWFIEKAVSTSASSMWYPHHDDLLAANIVTNIIEP